jgi:asparagine synthase (glutamine-hydrolysing)
MTVFLKYNKGYKWYTKEGISFKGYFYIDNIFYEAKNAVEYLTDALKTKTFKNITQSLNGIFSIVFSDKTTTHISCDISRTFPLFYTYQNNSVVISDSAAFLKEAYKLNEVDAVAEIEFKTSNHTHGSKTLLKNLYQLQASEYLVFEDNTIINRSFLFSYAVKTKSKINYLDLKKQGINQFENAFKRFVNSLQNKTVVIPLSSGLDSRLIAVLLKKYNYKNVVCYTYGNKNSFEIENSKKTAKTLGFKWHFIPYTEDLIANFLVTDQFKEYTHFAGKYSSMPYLQEFFALQYFKKDNLVPEDSIFVPGFAGDILGGSEFLKLPKNIKTKKLNELLFTLKFNNNPITKTQRKTLEKEIQASLEKLDNAYTQKIPSSVFEDYNIKERIAKYIFNSASQYLFFEYHFRFPFWDKNLLDFFKTVPENYKQHKILFNDILINEYFKPYNVYFNDTLQPKHQSVFIQQIKNQIKPYLPVFINENLIKRQDWNNYESITKQMLLSMQKKGASVKRSYNNYNEIITQWYIYIVKNKLS